MHRRAALKLGDKWCYLRSRRSIFRVQQMRFGSFREFLEGRQISYEPRQLNDTNLFRYPSLNISRQRFHGTHHVHLDKCHGARHAMLETQQVYLCLGKTTLMTAINS